MKITTIRNTFNIIGPPSIGGIGGAMTLLTLLLLTLLSTSTTFVVDGAVVEYDWTLSQVLGAKVGDGSLSPDCSDIWQERRWLYLGENNDDAGFTLPGPKIEATEGDLIRVTITNENEVMAVTVHWHGVYQKGTVYNDGTSQITQCSLAPFETQTYEFIAYPPGTHYWHSHQGMTATDGIAGPIVIHPKKENKQQYEEYDEERMLFLMDYYDQTSLQQNAGLFASQFGWIGNPASLLLNGKGLSKYCNDYDGRQPADKCFDECDSNNKDDDAIDDDAFENCADQCTDMVDHMCLETCGNVLEDWTPSILVERNKTYRFRIINGGGLVMQNIAITDHNMTVIEVDGSNTVPYEVSSLTIAPGQRYSVLVKADQGGEGSQEENFWLQSVVVGRSQVNMPVGNFILSYANSTDAVRFPSSNQSMPVHPDWNSTEQFEDFFDNLKTDNVSHYVDEVPALTANESDIVRYHLTLSQGYQPDVYDGKMYWALNNISFAYPKKGLPLIYTAVKESQLLGWPLPGPLIGTVDMPRKLDTNWDTYTNFASTEDGRTGPGYNISQTATSVIRLNEGDVAEFVIDNSVGPSGVSEFHPWHFHGHSYWVVGRGNGTFNETEDVPNYNLKNPVLRDTTVGLGGDWVALRFVANNPGVWYFHCHIESHLAMGMGFVVIVDPQKTGSLTDSVKYCAENQLEPIDRNTIDELISDGMSQDVQDEIESDVLGVIDESYESSSKTTTTTTKFLLLSSLLLSIPMLLLSAY